MAVLRPNRSRPDWTVATRNLLAGAVMLAVRVSFRCFGSYEGLDSGRAARSGS